MLNVGLSCLVSNCDLLCSWSLSLPFSAGAVSTWVYLTFELCTAGKCLYLCYRFALDKYLITIILCIMRSCGGKAAGQSEDCP